MKILEIVRPDDWHVHFRDGEILKVVVPETSRHFGRAIIMPNLIPPILNGINAVEYKKKIKKYIPESHDFDPLMTVYLTENTKKKELIEAYKKGEVFAAKLYPAGATTNSDSGVKNIHKIMNLLETMSEIGMPLLIHGEETNQNIDVFDREKVFIDNKLDYICKTLPELKVTLEHITTIEATSYVKEANNNLSATITPHHLVFNRNALFSGGIRPHHFCLPILKREKHRLALVEAAISGNKKFFLGTDTAPHLIKDKESSCGCAGVFNATYCLSILAQIFDNENSLLNFENFASLNGAKHYNVKPNKSKIKMIKRDKPINFQKFLEAKHIQISIFKPNFPVFWKVQQ